MIDHRAEALQLAETVTRAYSVGVLPAATIFALAQVHATLALAEQQRIANLIAYAALPNVVTCAETLPFDKTLAAPVTQRNEVRRTIREGLGL